MPLAHARPPSIPENAAFDESSGQWDVGETDEQKQPVGDHRLYRIDGSLVVSCRYEGGVLEGPYRR